jgi:lysozyme
MSKFPIPAPIVKAGLTGALAVSAGFIGYFEGRNLFAYLDPVGIPTICEGITRGVTLGEKRTPEQCDAALAVEVRRAANIVARNVTVPLSENRYAALISFVYNVGEGNFARSTLLRKLNAGDGVGACNEMTKWVYAKGRKLNGLVKRRETERALCLR